jgi:hypothetical protein
MVLLYENSSCSIAQLELHINLILLSSVPPWEVFGVEVADIMSALCVVALVMDVRLLSTIQYGHALVPIHLS